MIQRDEAETILKRTFPDVTVESTAEIVISINTPWEAGPASTRNAAVMPDLKLAEHHEASLVVLGEDHDRVIKYRTTQTEMKFVLRDLNWIANEVCLEVVGRVGAFNDSFHWTYRWHRRDGFCVDSNVGHWRHFPTASQLRDFLIGYIRQSFAPIPDDGWDCWEDETEEPVFSSKYDDDVRHFCCGL